MTTSGSLRGRDLISVADLSAPEVVRIFATTERLKSEFRATRRHAQLPLAGRTLAMLFQKPSLRTRVTFEAGMAQLGGAAIYLPEDSVMGATMASTKRSRLRATSRTASLAPMTESSGR